MRLRVGMMVGAVCGVVPCAWGQGAAGVAPIDTTALVRRAVEHRMDAVKEHKPLRYVVHLKDERHETTKQIVETRDGDVARLVAVSGRPLTVEEEQAETARLDALAANPEQQEHRMRGEAKDEERVDHLLSLLPDGLVYTMEGVEACAAGECYRLSFAPKPGWQPPDMEANLLRGVTGEVWIAQGVERLTKLEVHFTGDVDFGLGILGRLNKGGMVELEQAEVLPGDWELTRVQVDVTGRALLVKPLNYQITEELSGFAGVGSMGYREGIEVLKKGE